MTTSTRNQPERSKVGDRQRPKGSPRPPRSRRVALVAACLRLSRSRTRPGGLEVDDASGDAPFCGPYVAAAPLGPRGDRHVRGDPQVASASRASSPSRFSVVLSIAAPSARRIPAPPSSSRSPDPEGDGPDPRLEDRVDTSPVPCVEAPTVALIRASRESPEPPRLDDPRAPSLDRSREALRADAIGSVARTVRHAQPPAAAMATAFPRRLASGARRHRHWLGQIPASAIAVATSTGGQEPLKDSGATMTRIGRVTEIRAGLREPRVGLGEEGVATSSIPDPDHRRALHVGELDHLEGEAAPAGARQLHRGAQPANRRACVAPRSASSPPGGSRRTSARGPRAPGCDGPPLEVDLAEAFQAGALGDVDEVPISTAYR